MDQDNKFEHHADAAIIARDYVCAHCYGHLVVTLLDETTPNGREYSAVKCPNCGLGAGFVTKSWAETRKAESSAELAEAKLNLGGIIGKENNAPLDDILKAFGG